MAAYRRLIRAFLVEWVPLTAETWTNRQAEILGVANGLCEGATAPDKATTFLSWEQHDQSLSVAAPASTKDAGPNVYRVRDGERHVDIRLGSIHSVKGQSHLATMLLSTFWHAHSSKKMLPWLLGKRSNKSGAKIQDSMRLLQTYVAMTRPSHLVCLAVQRSTFGSDQVFGESLEILKNRGWLLAEIVAGIAQWRK
jgi:hypothetical protein